MKLKVPFIAILLVAVGVTAAAAATWDYQKAKVRITYPDQWSHEVNDASGDVIGSPCGNAAVIVRLAAAKDIETVLNETLKGLAERFGALADREPKTTELKINGMDAFVIEDIITADGKTEIAFALLITPSKDVLVVTAVGTPAAAKKYDAEVSKIVLSITPIR